MEEVCSGMDTCRHQDDGEEGGGKQGIVEDSQEEM